jgi:cyclopropane fatty-acyl-phospholipid synthase-like methyltransferase
MHNSELILDMIKNYDATAIEKQISPNDAMNNEWYFSVGRSAVEVIIAACTSSTIQAVNNILDLPCGHGRVLRHLVRLFPKSKIDACDLDMDGVNFCATTFGANPTYSHEELTEVDFPNRYDIIWIGSLFTHTSQEVTSRWLAHLSKFLTPQGIIIATFHGRWCQYVHQVAPYIKEDAWQGILNDYSSMGYGYRDYLREENHPFIQGAYGISLVKPHVTIQILENIPDIRIFLYMERGWADHQDVVVFGHPSFNKLWPGMKG